MCAKRFETLETGEALILHIHFGTETIYEMIKLAKSNGYTVDLAFFTKLSSWYHWKTESLRREYCDHLPISTEDINHRFEKSLETFPILLKMVDKARFFDTTDIPPILHIDKNGEDVKIHPEKPWMVEELLRNVPVLGYWNKNIFQEYILEK